MSSVLALVPALVFGLGIYWIGLQIDKELRRRKRG
jgi:hypothetical protein